MTARKIFAALLAGAAVSATAQSTPTHRFDPGLRFAFGYGMAIADFSGDGRVDRLSFNGDSGNPTLAKGMDWGHFDLPRPVTDCGNCATDAIFPIQADADPAMEAVFVTGSELHVLDLTPIGGGARHMVHPVRDAPSRPVAIDLDHDGFDDIAIMTRTGQWDTDHRDTYQLSIFENRWPGGFTRRDGAAYSTRDRSPFIDGTTFDVDGDGLDDLVAGPCPGACLLRQDPNATLNVASLADQAPDSVPSDLQAYRDIDEDGDADRVRAELFAMSVDVQVGPGIFARAFDLRSYGGGQPGGAALADVDGNGLVDVVYNSDTWLVRAMHVTPGTFSYFPQGAAFGGRPALIDVDQDGCLDAVDNGGKWFRGRHCTRADIAIVAAGGPGEFSATVAHVEGTRGFTGETLRVAFAPAISDDILDGKHDRIDVTAPAECTEVAARPPRRLYDCTVGALAAGGSASFAFAVDARLPSRPFAALHGIAFRYGGQADADPGNDRAFAPIAHYAVPLARPAPPAAMPPPRIAPKPAPSSTPVTAPRAGSLPQESIR